MLKKLLTKPEVKDMASEDLKKIVDKCIQEKGATQCERSYNIYKCYRSNIAFKH